MAATYPATNLQLQYNSGDDKWSFNEVAYDYPTGQVPSWQGYTTPDVPFPTDDTPPPPGDDEDRDPCPPGYTYDETLKQCIPDANYRAPAYAGEPGIDDRRDEPTRVEFDASTPEGRKSMYEHGLSHGYFTTDTSKGGAYEFQGPKKTGMTLWGLEGIAQFGEDSEYNRYINELAREDAKRKAAGQSPILAQAVGFFGLAKTFKDWGTYAINAAQNVRQTDTTTGFQEIKKTESPLTVPTRAADISGYRTFEDQEAELEQDREQEVHEERVKQEIEKTKQQKIKTDKERAASDEATGKFSGGKTDIQIDRDTGKFSGSPHSTQGGSFSDTATGKYSGSPKSEPKRRFSPAGGPRPGDR